MKKALIFDTYDDVNIRLQYIRSAMERNGYSVSVFLADFDHYAKSYIVHKRENIQYLHALPYKKNLSYARIHSHMEFAKTCVKKAEEEENVSLIYVMVPPNSLVKEFAGYHERHPEVKIWFDVCDMWPESLPLSNSLKKAAAPVLNIWKNRRDHFINIADLITPECNLFREKLLPVTDSHKMHTLYLCQNHHPCKENDDLSIIHFLYLGSINHIIDIERIVSFLKEMMKQKKILFHLVGDGESRKELTERLEEENIPYHYYGKVYDEEKKQEIYAQCHFGLNIMKDSVYVGLTMKSLDYFSHDLPVINNIQGDTLALVREKNIGLNLDENTVNTLSSLTSDSYHQMVRNTEEVFANTFAESVIEDQLDALLKELEV